ncbi:MAG: hypothetical protein OHK0017_01200 [Patescibacteria group bacterium]
MILKHTPEIISQNIKFFQDRNNINLPYAFQLKGGEPGPHILISGATHGHEVAGVDAIIRFNDWLKENGLEINRGKLTFLIGNPEAYRQSVRFVDYNLNRAFVAEPAPNLEGDRVRQIRKFTSLERVDFILDLHSVSIGDFKAVCYIINPKNTELAFKIGNLDTHYTFYEEHLPGMLIEEVENSLAIECGNNNLITTIDTAFEHIVNTVREYNLIDVEKLPVQFQITHKPEFINVYESVDAIRPGPNFNWMIPVEELITDYPINKHQTYAVDNNGPKESPCDAVLLMPDANPKPGDADAGFIAVKHQVKTEKVLDEITKLAASTKLEKREFTDLSQPIFDVNILSKFYNANAEELSYSKYTGNPKKGKKVMVVGAIHGSEPAGVEASMNLFQLLKPLEDQINGQIIFALGNPKAFLERTRLIDRNLNRAFVSEPDLNLYEHQRAEEIKNFIRNQDIDFVLDLHCVSKGNLRCLIYTDTEKNQTYLQEFKAINRHLVFNPDQIKGSMIGFANELGIDSLAVECGNDKDPESVKFAEKVIWEVLIRTGLIDSEFDINLNLNHQEQHFRILKYTFLETIPVKPEFKFVESEAQTDFPVHAGQVYATSLDGPITATFDGYLFFPDHSPNQNDSDAGFICQREQLEA